MKDEESEICTTPLTFYLPGCQPVGRMQNPTIIAANNLLIAPNPSKEGTSISYIHSVPPTIVVYTLLGKLIASYEATTPSGSWELNTSTLAAGVYIVVMKENDLILMQQKLIVE